MSQKKEKYAREMGRRMTNAEDRLNRLESPADNSFEDHMNRIHYMSECRERAAMKERADHHRERALAAEAKTRVWQAVAFGAIISAILVLIVAITAVKADAKTMPAAPPVSSENELTISGGESATQPENDAKNTPVFVTSLTQITDSDKVAAKIYNVPLDAELQQLLRQACEESGNDMELALAVIWAETDFRNIVGDDGASEGYMQVQKRWHADRMARLGVTDLMDPASNFRTGCDYLAELLDKYPLANALSFYNSGDPALRPYCEEVMDYMAILRGEGGA